MVMSLNGTLCVERAINYLDSWTEMPAPNEVLSNMPIFFYVNSPFSHYGNKFAGLTVPQFYFRDIGMQVQHKFLATTPTMYCHGRKELPWLFLGIL